VKDFFKHLQGALLPDPKTKHCPHCGGGKCFGLCGIAGEQSGEAATVTASIGADGKERPDYASADPTE